jgi:hypothetical protein
MPSYTITEPHPTVPKNSYTHSGRGGAGNFFRVSETTSPLGVPVRAPTNPTTTTAPRFYSGRGGAGNIHSSAERQALSFDEEFQRAEIREKTSTITHVGRGGAGNVFSSLSSSTEDKTRRDSNSTNGSVRSGFWGRLSNVGSH